MAGLFGIATIQKIRAAINSAFASVSSSGTTLTFTKGDGSATAVNLDAANRVGTATVGAGNRPIFLSSGTPTASSTTVGSSTKPVFMSGGTLQKLPAIAGVGTIITAFFMGPLIDFFNHKVAGPFLYGKREIDKN